MSQAQKISTIHPDTKTLNNEFNWNMAVMMGTTLATLNPSRPVESFLTGACAGFTIANGHVIFKNKLNNDAGGLATQAFQVGATGVSLFDLITGGSTNTHLITTGINMFLSRDISKNQAEQPVVCAKTNRRLLKANLLLASLFLGNMHYNHTHGKKLDTPLTQNVREWIAPAPTAAAAPANSVQILRMKGVN